MQQSVGVPLAPLTTMRVGGPADRLVTASSTEELIEAVREADAAARPVLVLSGGSNVVVADEGFAGNVVRVATRGVQVESADFCGGVSLRVAAGEDWDALVARAVAEGWSGIEALSGIPGYAGSTPIQNVGAYGQEVASTVAQVRVWDRRRCSVRTMANADCGFAYRDSLFKRSAGRYVVLEVGFQLPLADRSAPVRYPALADELDVPAGIRVPLAEVRAAVLALRRRRGMVLDEADHDTWSCGSFFTNPVLSPEAYAALRSRAAPDGPGAADPPCWPAPDGSVKTSAAWLIERAGYHKGFGMPGPAALSTKHPLAVTNRGTARAADVLALARQVRDGVADAFGVRLVNEPVLVGLSL
ncbi:MAG: UDP-N-acetylmuramate dehydrogenase [Dermatophilaceae bacterium]